jgi:hypothetical protein
MASSSSSISRDCSLLAMARDLNQEMIRCQSRNPYMEAIDGGASCVATALIESFHNMTKRCESRPGCAPTEYIVGAIEDVDARNKVVKFAFGKLQKAAATALGLPPPVTDILVGAAGCVVGGTVGLVAGARSTPFAPYVGGSIGAVAGCRTGKIVAQGTYDLWDVVVRTADTYEDIKTIFRSLETRSAACGVQPIAAPAIRPEERNSLNTRLFFTKDAAKSLAELPNSPFTRPTPTSFVLNPSTIIYSTPTMVPPRGLPFTAAPIVHPAPQAPCSSRDPVPSSAGAGLFTWIEVEDAAQKLIDLAADLTGVTGAVSQTKELKEMFVTILSDPENAPKIIFNQVIKEPERMLQRIISTPDEFIKNGRAFLNDPTFTGALNTVGTIYTIIGLANDLLPMLDRITTATLRNPLSAPIVITKELGRLVTAKIVGVVKLGEGLLRHPGKTLEHMGKGIIKSPEQLCKNVKNLFGGSRKSRKRRKRRARQLEQLKLQAEQQMRAETAKLKQEIITALPACYTTARHQWMIPETKTPETYFSDMMNDWRSAVSQRRYQGNCAEFIRTVHSQLLAGQFNLVVQLSPTAHTAEMSVPAIVAYAVIGVAKDTLLFACEIRLFEKAIQEHEKITIEFRRQMDSYDVSLRSLQSITAGKTEDQIAAEFRRALANPDAKARALALLGPAKK